MKKLIFSLSALLATLSVSAQFYTYPQPFQASENAEPVRSEFLSYRKAKDALANNPDSTQNRSLLDGQWAYKVVGDNKNVDVALLAREAKLDGWQKIEIPSSKSLAEGTNFKPKKQPVMEQTPEAPAKVQTLVLARDFVVPFDYTDRALYLHVGATTGAMTLYINGEKVGSRSDSHTPSQFNISKFVERGLNRVTICVDSWSDAKYLESGINKLFSGISRPVYLFAQPKIRVFDIMMKTSLDPTYKNGLLEIAMLLKTELLNPHEVTVYYDLYDQNGKLVNQENKSVEVSMRQQDTIRFTASIMNVERWNAEDPYLYTVMFRIKREGRYTEYVTRKVGFRTIETTDKILINGVPTVFQGINADMFPSLVSDATPDKQLFDELATLRKQGVNAIRTPYPLRSEFYDMCDTLGFYVVATANLNSGDATKSIMKGGTLANNPAWRQAHIDRVVDNYEYLKVHPSIIAWGLGEDAGNGYNMYQAYNELRRRDQTRAIVYNGAEMEWNTDWYMPKNTDKQYGVEKQPLVYSRSDSPEVWKTANGGFLSHPTDKPASNLSPQNITTMVNGNYAFVSIKPVDEKKGTYEVYNNLPSWNLSRFGLTYKIYNKSGKLTASGNIPLDVPAQGHAQTVTVPGSVGKTVVLSVDHLASYTNKQ